MVPAGLGGSPNFDRAGSWGITKGTREERTSTERGSLDAKSGLIVLGDWGGEAPPITAVERSRFRERWMGRYFWKGRVVV